MKTPDTTEAMPSANNNTDFRLLNSFKKATHWVENLSATSTFEEMKNSSRWLLHKDKRPFYIDGRPRSGELDGLLDTNRLATYSKAKRRCLRCQK